MLLAINPDFRQIVVTPTRANKILDVVITDLASYLQIPDIIPPITPDDGATGAQSDHKGVLVCPRNKFYNKSRNLGTKSLTFPDSAKFSF